MRQPERGRVLLGPPVKRNRFAAKHCGDVVPRPSVVAPKNWFARSFDGKT
jgi:hypothetical protein